MIKIPANIGFAAVCNKWNGCCLPAVLAVAYPHCSFKPGTLVTLLNTMCVGERVDMARGLARDFGRDRTNGWAPGCSHLAALFCDAFGLVIFPHRWPRLLYDFHLHKQPLPVYTIEVEAISGVCV
jgi:hypothetical protein